MKILIEEAERYPIYEAAPSMCTGTLCEVTAEQVARWARIQREWDEMQREQAECYDAGDYGGGWECERCFNAVVPGVVLCGECADG